MWLRGEDNSRIQALQWLSRDTWPPLPALTTQDSARGACALVRPEMPPAFPMKGALSHQHTGNPINLSKALTDDGRRQVLFSSVTTSQTVQLQGKHLAAKTNG